MATHSSVLAWKIPRTKEQGSHYPKGHKESDMTEQLHFTDDSINSFLVLLEEKFISLLAWLFIIKFALVIVINHSFNV